MLIAAGLSVSVTWSIVPETDDEIDSMVAAPTTRQWRRVRHPLVRVGSAGASNWTRNNPKRPDFEFPGQAAYSSIQARRKDHLNRFPNEASLGPPRRSRSVARGGFRRLGFYVTNLPGLRARHVSPCLGAGMPAGGGFAGGLRAWSRHGAGAQHLSPDREGSQGCADR